MTAYSHCTQQNRMINVVGNVINLKKLCWNSMLNSVFNRVASINSLPLSAISVCIIPIINWVSESRVTCDVKPERVCLRNPILTNTDPVSWCICVLWNYGDTWAWISSWNTCTQHFCFLWIVAAQCRGKLTVPKTTLIDIVRNWNTSAIRCVNKKVDLKAKLQSK